MTGLALREASVLVQAYGLAAIPIGGLLLAGRMSPMYRVPGEQVARWWSWFALAIVLTALAGDIAGAAAA